MELWSTERDTGNKVGFTCAHDGMSNIFYAMPASSGDASVHSSALCQQGTAAQRATKSAITALLDVAEACQARRITIGLSPEHAACSDFVCALLYLGFQVAPSRKSPMVDCALTVSLDIAWPPQGEPWDHTNTNTGTSECSTSAEDNADYSESDDSSPAHWADSISDLVI